MDGLDPKRRAQLRAYWMLQHSDHPERMLLSGPVTAQERLTQFVQARGGGKPQRAKGGIPDAILARAARDAGEGGPSLAELRATFGGGW